MNPAAGAAAIIFGFILGGTLTLALIAPPGASSLCFALAAFASLIACASCFLLGAQKGPS